VPSLVHMQDTIDKLMASRDVLVLELGCGDRKRHSDAIGIDVLDCDGVDIVGDIYTVLQHFPDQSISAVYAYHCFEHLLNLNDIMVQLSRVMKTKAALQVVVPHFSNPYYYSDATHRQPFGLYTFSYFAHETLFTRKCPHYQRNLNFVLKKARLVFKSPRPFYGRWAIKRVVQAIFNLNHYLMEFYEENLCWVIPCYEIDFELERL